MTFFTFALRCYCFVYPILAFIDSVYRGTFSLGSYAPHYLIDEKVQKLSRAVCLPLIDVCFSNGLNLILFFYFLK